MKGKVIKKLYAIDGTCSGGCVDWPASKYGPYPNSNVKRLYKEYWSEVHGGLWEGPKHGVTGYGSTAIVFSVVDKVCEHFKRFATSEDRDACKSESFKVYLLGWSRGGVIAVEVARSLLRVGCFNKTKIPVEWIGLFDAVNQTYPSWDDPNLPENVKVVSHAKKSDNGRNLWGWGLKVFPGMDYTSSAGKVYEKKFWKEPRSSNDKKEPTSHGEIGLGWSVGQWSNGDDAIRWMRDEVSTHTDLL